MRGGSTDLFTLCKVHLVLVPQSVPGNQATDHLNFLDGCTILHIDIPTSGLVSIFIKCRMWRVFSQRATHIYTYIRKNSTIQLTSSKL